MLTGTRTETLPGTPSCSRSQAGSGWSGCRTPFGARWLPWTFLPSRYPSSPRPCLCRSGPATPWSPAGRKARNIETYVIITTMMVIIVGYSVCWRILKCMYIPHQQHWVWMWDLPQQPVLWFQPQFAFLSLHPSPTRPIQIEEYSIFNWYRCLKVHVQVVNRIILTGL